MIFFNSAIELRNKTKINRESYTGFLLFIEIILQNSIRLLCSKDVLFKFFVFTSSFKSDVKILTDLTVLD